MFNWVHYIVVVINAKIHKNVLYSCTHDQQYNLSIFCYCHLPIIICLLLPSVSSMSLPTSLMNSISQTQEGNFINIYPWSGVTKLVNKHVVEIECIMYYYILILQLIFWTKYSTCVSHCNNMENYTYYPLNALINE